MDKCTCECVGAGLQMKLNGCTVHETDFSCDHCSLHICSVYRPNRWFDVALKVWPRCVCGHLAQDHNVKVYGYNT